MTVVYPYLKTLTIWPLTVLVKTWMPGHEATDGSTLILSMPQQNTTILISQLTISIEPSVQLYNFVQALDCTIWALKENSQLTLLILKKLMHFQILKDQLGTQLMDLHLHKLIPRKELFLPQILMPTCVTKFGRLILLPLIQFHRWLHNQLSIWL